MLLVLSKNNSSGFPAVWLGPLTAEVVEMTHWRASVCAKCCTKEWIIFFLFSPFVSCDASQIYLSAVDKVCWHLFGLKWHLALKKHVNRRPSGVDISNLAIKEVMKIRSSFFWFLPRQTHTLYQKGTRSHDAALVINACGGESAESKHLNLCGRAVYARERGSLSHSWRRRLEPACVDKSLV